MRDFSAFQYFSIFVLSANPMSHLFKPQARNIFTGIIIEKEKRRLTAYKVKIADVNGGKYVSLGGFNPSYVLSNNGLRLSRVHVLATVTNTYLTEDNKYAFIVLDDGTGVIRSKAFQDTAILNAVNAGDVVDFVGKVREYNDERYLVPEVVVPVTDPNLEPLRKLEIMVFNKKWAQKRALVLEKKSLPIEELKKEMLEKNRISSEDVEGILEAEETVKEGGESEGKNIDSKASREIVLKTISDLDKGEGVAYSEIIEKANLPENVTETALNELLEEGSCYEPRPGIVRVL